LEVTNIREFPDDASQHYLVTTKDDSRWIPFPSSLLVREKVPPESIKPKHTPLVFKS